MTTRDQISRFDQGASVGGASQAAVDAAQSTADTAQAAADALRGTDIVTAVVDASVAGSEKIVVTRSDASTYDIDVSALAGGGSAAQTTFSNVAAALAGSPTNVQAAIDALDTALDAIVAEQAAQDALIAQNTAAAAANREDLDAIELTNGETGVTAGDYRWDNRLWTYSGATAVDLPDPIAEPGLRALGFKPITESDLPTVLTVADDDDGTDPANALAPGDYQTDSVGGAFTVHLAWAAGGKWNFEDLGAADVNQISIGDAGDTFSLDGVVDTGPFSIDAANARITITGLVSADEFLVETLPIGSTTTDTNLKFADNIAARDALTPQEGDTVQIRVLGQLQRFDGGVWVNESGRDGTDATISTVITDQANAAPDITVGSLFHIISTTQATVNIADYGGDTADTARMIIDNQTSAPMDFVFSGNYCDADFNPIGAVNVPVASRRVFIFQDDGTGKKISRNASGVAASIAEPDITDDTVTDKGIYSPQQLHAQFGGKVGFSRSETGLGLGSNDDLRYEFTPQITGNYSHDFGAAAPGGTIEVTVGTTLDGTDVYQATLGAGTPDFVNDTGSFTLQAWQPYYIRFNPGPGVLFDDASVNIQYAPDAGETPFGDQTSVNAFDEDDINWDLSETRNLAVAAQEDTETVTINSPTNLEEGAVAKLALSGASNVDTVYTLQTGGYFDKANQPLPAVTVPQGTITSIDFIVTSFGLEARDYPNAPAADVTPTLIDSSVGAVTETLTASTGTGAIRFFTNDNVTNTATLAVQAGETLNGVTDGTFLFSNYASGTQFRADEVTGGWVVSVVGASTQTDIARIEVGWTAPSNFKNASNYYEADDILFADPTGKLSLSNGYVTGLEEGKTYRISGTIHKNATGSDTANYEIRNVTANALIGKRIYQASTNFNSNEAGNGGFSHLYTAPAGAEIAVLWVNGADNLAGVNSSFIVEEVPATEAVLAGMVTPSPLARARLALVQEDASTALGVAYNAITINTAASTLSVMPYTEATYADGGMVADVSGWTDNNAASQLIDGTNTTMSITVPRDGKYRIHYKFPEGDSGTIDNNDRAFPGVAVNGVLVEGFDDGSRAVSGSLSEPMDFTTVLTLSAGDMVQPAAFVEGGDAEAWNLNNVTATSPTGRTVTSYFDIEEMPTSTVVMPDALEVEDINAVRAIIDVGDVNAASGALTVISDQAVTASASSGASSTTITVNHPSISLDAFISDSIESRGSAGLDNDIDSVVVTRLSETQTSIFIEEAFNVVQNIRVHLQLEENFTQKTVINTTDAPIPTAFTDHGVWNGLDTRTLGNGVTYGNGTGTANGGGDALPTGNFIGALKITVIGNWVQHDFRDNTSGMRAWRQSLDGGASFTPWVVNT